MTQPPYPGQHPYPGQPPQTGPSNPGYPPPAPTSKTTTGIIITMSVIIVALAIIVAYLAYHKKDTPTTNPTPTTSTTPALTPTQTPTTTRTPTPGRGWTLNGNQLTGPNMTAQLPPGWQIGPNNGANNDGEIIDHKSRIKYWFNVPRTAEESCKKMTGEYRRSPNDPVDQIQGQTWSGKPVLVHQLMIFTSRSETHTFYCLDTGNRLSVLLDTSAWTENKEEARSAAQILLTTWQWK